MKYIRKSNQRGQVNMGWLQSNHSFSFGSYHDTNHMGISVLRVINDDIVQPGQGFGTHGHKNMEIISYVIEGALQHKDSTGNIFEVPAGEIQRMSAGSGIRHSEYNASDSKQVNFLQIWIEPNVNDIKPSYEQKKIEQNGPLTPMVTPHGDADSLSINQDVSIYRLELKPSESYILQTGQRLAYLHVIKGEFKLDQSPFSAGDAFALDSNDSVEIIASEALEALWFDLPLAH